MPTWRGFWRRLPRAPGNARPPRWHSKRAASQPGWAGRGRRGWDRRAAGGPGASRLSLVFTRAAASADAAAAALVGVTWDCVCTAGLGRFSPASVGGTAPPVSARASCCARRGDAQADQLLARAFEQRRNLRHRNGRRGEANDLRGTIGQHADELHLRALRKPRHEILEIGLRSCEWHELWQVSCCTVTVGGTLVCADTD